MVIKNYMDLDLSYHDNKKTRTGHVIPKKPIKLVVGHKYRFKEEITPQMLKDVVKPQFDSIGQEIGTIGSSGGGLVHADWLRSPEGSLDQARLSYISEEELPSGSLARYGYVLAGDLWDSIANDDGWSMYDYNDDSVDRWVTPPVVLITEELKADLESYDSSLEDWAILFEEEVE